MTGRISRRLAIQAIAGSSLARAMLTRPWSRRKKMYDYVVVGSGYGGSVMAARLAGLEPRPSVCVLERGREWLTGSFPDTTDKLFASLQSPANPTGLLSLYNYPQLSLLKAFGIGGGSLIDCGVASEPDDAIWEHRAWPKALRDDHQSGSLKAYYARARTVLAVTPDPAALEAGKVKALARSIGRPAAPANLAINWTVDGPNPQGITMKPCIRCGDCLTGCNVGAKNSLDKNYLPMAVVGGAELYAGVRLDWIERVKTGYRLHLRVYESRFTSKPETLDAANVILAAGCPGSAEVLLRSALHGLPISKQIGARFGGNGEVTCIAYATDYRTDVIGWGARQSGPSAQRLSVVPPGPSVVGRAQAPSDQAGGPFLIEDLSCPSALVPVLRFTLAALRDSRGIQDAAARERKAARILIDLDPSGRKIDEGALNYSMLYRGTGIEEPVGKFVMDTPPMEPAGRLRLETPTASDGNTAVLDYLRRRAQALEPVAIYDNVFGRIFNVRVPVLTQPLGGCPMGETPDTGVVNHRGQVFARDGGVLEGLFVVDASIIPAPLGTGPLLTVAALAERNADLILKHPGSRP